MRAKVVLFLIVFLAIGTLSWSSAQAGESASESESPSASESARPIRPRITTGIPITIHVRFTLSRSRST